MLFTRHSVTETTLLLVKHSGWYQQELHQFKTIGDSIASFEWKLYQDGLPDSLTGQQSILEPILVEIAKVLLA